MLVDWLLCAEQSQGKVIDFALVRHPYPWAVSCAVNAIALSLTQNDIGELICQHGARWEEHDCRWNKLIIRHGRQVTKAVYSQFENGHCREPLNWQARRWQ